jgi:hypothetical protein
MKGYYWRLNATLLQDEGLSQRIEVIGTSGETDDSDTMTQQQSWAPHGARHQDWLTDRQSQCDSDYALGSCHFTVQSREWEYNGTQ